jgi:hypothetical protein
MNLTLAEKVAHFEATHCVGNNLTASDVMVRKLEGLADEDGNGVVSCQEFNSAYFTNISTTEFCMVTTNITSNSTSAPAVGPVRPTFKTSAGMSVVAFQTFLATAFATGIASLLA